MLLVAGVILGRSGGAARPGHAEGPVTRG